jgi:hypothetical protein
MPLLTVQALIRTLAPVAMGRLTLTRKNKILVAIFFAIFGFMGLLVPTQTANAASCPGNRAYCNSDEQRARNACNAYVEGAIWFNNTGSESTTDGYYALGVNISADATTVDVKIRGSVFTCRQGSGYDPYYAIHVSPNTNGGSYPNSSRLQTIGSNTLYRGNSQNANYQWTTQGSSINARLNVSGLAANNTNGPATQTVTIGLYRCFSVDGVSYSGPSACNVSAVPVQVTRAQAPRYNLTPTVTVNPSSAIEPGQNVTASPTVSATGGVIATNIAWQLSRFVVPAGRAVPGATANGTAPTTYYGNGATNEANGTRNFATGATRLADSSKASESLAAGSRICYALSVRPYTNANALNYWSHSAPSCVVVAKKPKVQVLGADLIVGRATAYNTARTSNIVTSTTSVDGLTYGSWSEYGIIPSGTVFGMASGAMYVDGSPANNLCDLSVLTISNNTGTNCVATQVGRYVTGATAPNVASRFTSTRAISGPAADTVNLPTGVYTANNGNLQLSSSQPIPKGKWIVINDPNSSVTITSNITYANTNLNSIKDIPQVVIIAQNIIIADSVTNVDAWLITNGTGNAGYINTCSLIPAGSPASLTSNKCNQRLTINGPVQANKLYMYRTAGSGPGAASGDPAEVFNLRSDAYLWATSYSSGGGRLPTVSTKELPPRF